MSKHRRHRSKDNDNNNFRCQQHAPGNNFPFGINPQQLLGMLGGMDISGLGNILSSMNRQGFDLNSMNQQMNNGFNYNNMNSYQNSYSNEKEDIIVEDEEAIHNVDNLEEEAYKEENIEKKKHKKDKNSNVENLFENEDENLVMLKSLRNIVAPNKVELIDKIIELYINDGFSKK